MFSMSVVTVEDSLKLFWVALAVQAKRVREMLPVGIEEWAVWFGFVAVFNGISTFVGYLMSKPIFVSASHQTGLDTKSITWNSIKVGIRRGGGRAQAKTWALVTMMHLAPPKGGPAEAGDLMTSSQPLLDRTHSWAILVEEQ